MNVEIWSDVVCPWCYIGKRRFERAMARFDHRDDVEIVWRSFELDPHAPAHRDRPLNEILAQKYGVSAAQAAAMNERVTGLAAAEGLTYHLDQARSGNTFNAHRLLHLATEHGRQGEMKEALLRAYFTEGLSIGDNETLVQIATQTGLPAAETQEMLASDTYTAEVRADEERAALLGITGVPFVVVDEKYGISGAQPADLFWEALNRAWQESRPLTLVGGASDAESCSGDECAIL